MGGFRPTLWGEGSPDPHLGVPAPEGACCRGRLLKWVGVPAPGGMPGLGECGDPP